MRDDVQFISRHKSVYLSPYDKYSLFLDFFLYFLKIYIYAFLYFSLRYFIRDSVVLLG